MNTVKSVYYGWATLIVAGGGAYVFAKRSINADRARKADLDAQKRAAQFQLEQAYAQSTPPSPPSTSSPRQPQPTPLNMPAYAGKPYTPPANGSVSSELGKRRADMGAHWEEGKDDVRSPSVEGTEPAATRHAPEDAEGRVREKSKYEASDVYRSRKGDRFS
ncbi:hypothetical protein BU23DRAFT_557392 [Bimuria novae-zelandiae CBS 107.79]|uniref:Uncharacterized protein n=1 Tax=Bimuria novae-zelandiae CBS 107.79 TaxID=1447943 RepID=A0A6A5V408_9PLEO|nr:hypothetical protein BU23DRAFT_557392 [Bimuria novae-zelandiae CBS 107.79]